MKIKKTMPKTMIGGALLLVVAGIISNVATAPAVRKYNEIKNKVQGA